jgi:hypothetical protein
MRRIPFRTPTPILETNFTATRTREGGAKTVKRATFRSTNVVLEPYEIAVIAPFSSELARFSSPQAETVFREGLVESVAKQIDTDAFDPSIAAISGERPASLSNGGASVTSTGTSASAILVIDSTSLRSIAMSVTHGHRHASVAADVFH